MKKVLSLIVLITMLLSLAACGNSQSKSYSKDDGNNYRVDESTLDYIDESAEALTEASTEVPTEGIGEKLSEYHPIDVFSNGFIWVEYKKDYKGLMNESGKIVYSVNKDVQTNPILDDGYTFYNIKADKLYTNIIIDKEGKETLTLQYTDDEAFKIWAQGDGTFLVSHQQSGFADIKYSIYAINPQGEMIGTEKEVEKQPTSVTYIGNKMFFISFDQYGKEDYNVLNCNNDNYFLLNGSRHYYPVYKGTGYIFSLIYHNSDFTYENYYGSFTYDDLSTAQTWKNWQSNHSTDNETYNELKKDHKYIQTYYFFGYDDKAIELPKFPETTSVEEIGDFSGGYLPIYLQGDDSKFYVTVVDTSGEQLYEPVKISEAKWFSNFNRFSSNGNVLVVENDQYNLIDISGNISPLSIDISDYIQVQGYDGDYLYYNRGIWSLKDNKELTAYFPVKGNIDTYSSDNSNEKSTGQKDYIIKSDFSIIGKWKNIGEYTYGQAQKGAIISFDGTNCNFFSPKDTYAFYKNGEHYKLDCTSPLADTVSFTVKIVDENNIDIFNGTDIIELQRVS